MPEPFMALAALESEATEAFQEWLNAQEKWPTEDAVVEQITQMTDAIDLSPENLLVLALQHLELLGTREGERELEIVTPVTCIANNLSDHLHHVLSGHWAGVQEDYAQYLKDNPQVVLKGIDRTGVYRAHVLSQAVLDYLGDKEIAYAVRQPHDPDNSYSLLPHEDIPLPTWTDIEKGIAAFYSG